MKSDNPEIKRLLGAEDNFGERLGLTKDWVYRIVSNVWHMTGPLCPSRKPRLAGDSGDGKGGGNHPASRDGRRRPIGALRAEYMLAS
jgi:hypothetical protein